MKKGILIISSIIIAILISFGIAFGSSSKVKDWTYSILGINQAVETGTDEEILVGGYTVEEAKEIINFITTTLNKYIEQLELVDTEALTLEEKTLLVNGELQKIISCLAYVENVFNTMIYEMAGVDVSAFSMEEKIDFIIDGFLGLLEDIDYAWGRINELNNTISYLQQQLGNRNNARVLYSFDDFTGYVYHTGEFFIEGFREGIYLDKVEEIILFDYCVYEGQILTTSYSDIIFAKLKNLRKITIYGNVDFGTTGVPLNSYENLREIDLSLGTVNSFMSIEGILWQYPVIDLKLIITSEMAECINTYLSISNWIQNNNIIVEIV